MRYTYTLFIIGILNFSIFSSQASLNVIADFGGESAIRFYESIQPVHSDEAPTYPNAIPSEIPEEKLLPIISHRWKVGQVQTQKVALHGALPIFLIGEDRISKNWIEKYHHQLKSLQAVGLVINVSSLENLQRIRQLAPELTFMPVVADELAERTGLQHYPVLMTSDYIIQSLDELTHYEQ